MMKNVVTLVTGGAAGLGKGTVEYFTKLGSKVVFCDLVTSNGQNVADELGDTVTYVPADVRNESDVQNVLNEIERRHGRLDALVNCAGQCRAHSIYNFTANKPINKNNFDLVMSHNVIGTFNTIRLAVKLMARNDPDANGLRGVIVNTAGVEGLRGIKGQSPTAAASGAIIAMTKPLAAELNEYGIRVATIVPGLMESDIFQPAPDIRRDVERFALTAPKSLGTPEHFANLAKLCVMNAGINATTIEISAGLCMD